MAYAAIAAALHEINFQGDAVIELAQESDFKPTRPLRESLKMSREFVRRVFRYTAEGGSQTLTLDESFAFCTFEWALT